MISGRDRADLFLPLSRLNHLSAHKNRSGKQKCVLILFATLSKIERGLPVLWCNQENMSLGTIDPVLLPRFGDKRSSTKAKHSARIAIGLSSHFAWQLRLPVWEYTKRRVGES